MYVGSAEYCLPLSPNFGVTNGSIAEKHASQRQTVGGDALAADAAFPRVRGAAEHVR